MSQVRIRLSPAWDEEHTDATIVMRLPRQLCAWEVMDLCELLKARSGKTVRVVLPAEAPSEWLDGWCHALAEAVTGKVEVQFTGGRRERRRVPACQQQGAQLEVSFHQRGRGRWQP